MHKLRNWLIKINISTIYIYKYLLAGCVAQLAECRSLAGELTLSCAPTGDHYVGKPSATGQPTRLTQPFIPPGSINEQQA